MPRWTHSFLGALSIAAALAAPLVQAQSASATPTTPLSAPTDAAAPAKGPPAGFVAPAEPKPDESNAQRNQSQPGNNAPFWRDVNGQQGFVTLPGAEKGMLIQPFADYPGSTLTTAGEAWRQVRNNVIVPYGAALLGIVLLAIAIFYFTRGPLGGHESNTGRRIERFTPFERAAHWSNATAFVILAVSGLVMAFGKYFLLPVIGSALFGWLTYALKTAHNFAGPVFAVSLVVVIATFIKDNFPQRGDLAWLANGGGMLSEREVPSHRFNAGEKGLFWVGVFVLGLIVVGSGLFLDKLVPGFVYTRGEMQVAHMIHAAAAVMMMAAFLGHIYMGTLGMKGAFSAMRTGYVDEAWAREHHGYWADDIRAGKIPAQRSHQPPPPLAETT
jgi:formate dehydrogenase subunit gamma